MINPLPNPLSPRAVNNRSKSRGNSEIIIAPIMRGSEERGSHIKPIKQGRKRRYPSNYAGAKITKPPNRRPVRYWR
jgi:hypothetical protein